MSNYDLGIVGGMGPLATCELYKRIIESTIANKDQDHIKICIISNSKIPDRTKAILEFGEDPFPYINESINDLIKLGCKRFIIPCNTAHYYNERYKKIKDIQFISMIDETIEYIYEKYRDKNICLIGTSGTINANIYGNDRIKILYPDNDDQYLIMNIINEIKSGTNPLVLLNDFECILNRINEKNKDMVFLLACTEISLFRELIKNYYVVDAMDILVQKTIEYCGYKTNKRRL